MTSLASVRIAVGLTATAGLCALLPLAPVTAAESREVVLTCDDGRTFTTQQRPGTAVFKDTQSRSVLVIQSFNGEDLSGTPDRLRTTCTFEREAKDANGKNIFSASPGFSPPQLSFTSMRMRSPDA